LKLIFTGPGKGKTSAAAGIAFRSWGHGRKVLVLLFLKDQRISGEWKAAHYLDSPRLVVKSFGRPCPYLGQTCCPGQQECIVTSLSFTRTCPLTINSSALRREATPACAKYLASLTYIPLGHRRGHCHPGGGTTEEYFLLVRITILRLHHRDRYFFINLELPPCLTLIGV
jgi:hypothetical protein